MAAPEILIAGPEHGAAIRDLIGANTWAVLDGIDWTDLGGQWVIVTLKDEIAGCAQLLPGKPIGRAENLCVHPALGRRDRARVASVLITYCMGLLRMAGCQAVLGLVGVDNDLFRRALSRRGFESVTDCTMMISRLE